MGQVNNLPQCTVTCPNGGGARLVPSLMRLRARRNARPPRPCPPAIALVSVIAADGQAVVLLCGMSSTECWAMMGDALSARGVVRRIRLVRVWRYRALLRWAVLQVMWRFQREVSVLGRVRGLFCKRSGVFKGIPSL